MNKSKGAVSTTSFGKFDTSPIDMLKEKGLELVFNPFGRKLTSQEIISLVSDSVGLIAGTENLRADVLPKLSNLKVISRCGAGLDNVDLVKAKELNIEVFSTPDGPTDAVAELTICLILCLLRKTPLMDRCVREGIWNKLMGNLLRGKKVRIIGLGKIGKKVASLLSVFGTELYFTDPEIKESADEIAMKCSLDELLSIADIITIHIPYNKENEYLIDSCRISLMKESSILINCSRGKIVDEEALYQALKEEKIAGAAIDVFEKEPYSGPLREMDNVILTPHIGSYAKEARIQMEKEASFNLLKGLEYV